MKKLLAILLLVVFVFAMSGCSPKTYTIKAQEIDARYITYELKDLIEEHIGTIVVGKVKTSKPIIRITENTDEKYQPDMLNKFEVEEVILGDVKKGDVIAVREQGDGSIFINRVYNRHGGYLKEGDYAILLLKNGTTSELKYVLQGEKTYREKDGTYVIEASSKEKSIEKYYNSWPLQTRIWLTDDKQIDQERNEVLLSYADGRAEIIKPGETYEEFVARLKDVIANISPAE